MPGCRESRPICEIQNMICGPGVLCRAMGIDRLNGHDLPGDDLYIFSSITVLIVEELFGVILMAQQVGAQLVAFAVNLVRRGAELSEDGRRH